MKQKIEWYREVLELEPGSRVFFPLAKLLAADGKTAEAVSALKLGLLRHPDHVEARLLLVELLFLQNEGQELQTEMDGLVSLLASYPGFWKAWEEQLAISSATRDASLALRFFAAAIQGQELSWAGIIEYGLKSLAGKNEGRLASPSFLNRKISAQEDAALRNSPKLAAAAGGAAKPVASGSVAKACDTEDEKAGNTHGDEAEEGAVLKPAVELPVFSSGPEPDGAHEAGEDEEPEEAFSLRTRSMAEVLAEQGDLAGALDIYQELMHSASETEKTSLATRADELARRMSSGHAEPGRQVEKASSPGMESTRLVSLLESLAQRLEDRAVR